MDLDKINLSKIQAIGHNEENLGLLIKEGENLEYIEIPAPFEAYEGLQELNEIVGEFEEDCGTPKITPKEEVVYQYQRQVEVRVTETLSQMPGSDVAYRETYYYQEESYPIYQGNDKAQLTQADYQASTQSLRLEFDDGSIYEYGEVDPELWQDFSSLLEDSCI